MPEFKNTKIGSLALVQQREDGSIKQIGLTQEQSDMLQNFCAILSKEQPLVTMPEDYDLQLKSEK